MTDALFVPSCVALVVVFTVAGLAIFSAHIPVLARLTGAADPEKEDR